MKADQDEVETRLLQAMQSGLGPTSAEAMDAAEAHRANITRWFYDCDYAIHRGLGIQAAGRRTSVRGGQGGPDGGHRPDQGLTPGGTMAGQASAATAADSRDVLLGIYLNDHLAGSTGGLELARRTAGAHKGTAVSETLSRLANEIQEDRQALMEIMTTLEVPVRQYKVASAWVAEKVGRLKLNGRLLDRATAQLGTVESLRMMASAEAFATSG